MSKVQVSSRTAPKNISVYLRIRPPVPLEKGHTFNNIRCDPKDSTVVTITRKSGSKDSTKEYRFNRVFDAASTQKDVYDTLAKGAVDASFDGQHGVIFVYGQTGSGKTFTISNNDPNHLGVLQQAMTDTWARINSDTAHDYTCSVSYVQLYNELLTDLLDDKKGPVRIQIGSEGRGDVDLVAQSTGLPIEKPVHDYKSTMELFHLGMSRKEMQSTSMNLTSSRSHTVFTFNLKKSAKATAVVTGDGDGGEANNGGGGAGGGGGGGYISLEGRLVLCDLAGSERVSKTHAEGKTLDEATHINGSLLVLGKVVAALTEHSQHAPFRESKLTRILQYSLLGNGNTSIMINISPSDNNTEESISAVLFGQRAIQIKQDAKRHEVLDYKALYLQLMAELDAKNDNTLKDALDEEKLAYEQRIAALQDQIQTLTLENDALKGENAQLRSGLSPERVAQLTRVAAVDGSGGSGGADGSGVDGAAGAAQMAGGGDGGGTNWLVVVSKLRCMILDRDARLQMAGEQQIKLGTQLAEERRRCFSLAKKMQSLGLRYKMERTFYMKRLDELGLELAALKGTDYLNTSESMTMPQTAMSPRGDAHADPSALSPQTPSTMSPGEGNGNNNGSGSGGNEVGLSDELEKALAQVRALRAERIELLVYQNKTVKAIRMLAAEKEAMLRRGSNASA